MPRLKKHFELFFHSKLYCKINLILKVNGWYKPQQHSWQVEQYFPLVGLSCTCYDHSKTMLWKKNWTGQQNLACSLMWGRDGGLHGNKPYMTNYRPLDSSLQVALYFPRKIIYVEVTSKTN